MILLRWSVIFPLAIFWILSCASVKPVSSDTIQRDLGFTAKRISENRVAAYSLRDARVGMTGYYYIVDIEGFVVFHPVAVIIGKKFLEDPYIKMILEKKNGCLREYIKDKEREYLVFFRAIDEREILCLSIPSDEVTGPREECLKASE